MWRGGNCFVSDSFVHRGLPFEPPSLPSSTTSPLHPPAYKPRSLTSASSNLWFSSVRFSSASRRPTNLNLFVAYALGCTHTPIAYRLTRVGVRRRRGLHVAIAIAYRTGGMAGSRRNIFVS